ncbi:amino acid ABC transporter substrate-binding protein (PAAT family) [Orbus hercynius]|uniref:Amino acid ABC transporter substrate-binding protein (PAAT family) n=1 Tax=Orbus hercynius TaxID=593135 RepID=A0A495RIN5_9GAMM|nr:amino acid ABC transporter substrate-binding protein [Orbus hercynius]RKS87275.1 amino acid ABC transporter substrate-binding protein (PAAT family) [Orbus hercynius]
MRKYFFLPIMTFFAAFLLSACDNSSKQNAANEDTNTQMQTIVVGLDDDFPPMGFRDESNNLVGFDIDLATEAAKRANLNVEFKPIDWSAKEAELNSGRVDALWNGLTITDYRKENVLFSKPYMVNQQIIVVRPNSDIQSKADLAGKVIGLQNGSSALDAVNADPIHQSFGELNQYADNVTALLDLGNERLDAVVVDGVVGRYYVAKKPDDYRILDDNFGEEQYGVGFKQGNTELQQKIQNALDSMEADGTSAKISEKWFGKDVTK